ncbi:MAG: SpoIIE family protein phosphatase [Candidatus Dormiibacterota bacterium]
MLTKTSVGNALLDVATASRAHPDSTVSGDASLAVPTRSGALLAVIDGLGHGEDAAQAANLAIATVRDWADRDLESIVDACEVAVRKSRGCVMGLVALAQEAEVLKWVGVGNVEGVIWGSDGGHCRLVGRPGIIGMGRQRVHIASVSFAPGDVLALATDGIAPAGLDAANVRGGVAEIAADILAHHARSDDDALVLVARRDRRPRDAVSTP